MPAAPKRSSKKVADFLIESPISCEGACARTRIATKHEAARGEFGVRDRRRCQQSFVRPYTDFADGEARVFARQASSLGRMTVAWLDNWHNVEEQLRKNA